MSTRHNARLHDERLHIRGECEGTPRGAAEGEERVLHGARWEHAARVDGASPPADVRRPRCEGGAQARALPCTEGDHWQAFSSFYLNFIELELV